MKLHKPCSSCGSSDARVTYDSGDFCFSCRKFFNNGVSGFVTESRKSNDIHTRITLPTDTSTNFGSVGKEWVHNAGTLCAELAERGVRWSDSRQQIVYPWYDEQGTLLAYQARNFPYSRWSERTNSYEVSQPKTKYFTQGDIEQLLPIYESVCGTSTKLVIVEDCLSAIKIARQASAMPCLGSDISRPKLARLRARMGPSCAFVVWMDGNMYHKAQRIAQRLEMLGAKAQAVWTELDPKYHSNEEISQIIQNNT